MQREIKNTPIYFNKISFFLFDVVAIACVWVSSSCKLTVGVTYDHKIIHLLELK